MRAALISLVLFTGVAPSEGAAPSLAVASLPPAWTVATRSEARAALAPTPAHDEEGGGETEGGVSPQSIVVTRPGARASRAACLAELRRQGVPYQPAPPRRLIWLPVRITGPIHGLTYKALYTRAPPLVDCQFALGLARAARVLHRFGVVRVLYTSTWRPAPRRSWRRVGHHPQGMAMDINELVLRDGTRLNILKQWERLYGGPGKCVGHPRTHAGARLRRMLCALERAHIFLRIISPDSDFGHRNHWHLSGARLGEAFVRQRWCGRALSQPLPGDRGFSRYYYWYSCWKFRNPRTRARCYRRRARHKPRPPVRFPRPRLKPRVGVWLSTQMRAAPHARLSPARSAARSATQSPGQNASRGKP